MPDDEYRARDSVIFSGTWFDWRPRKPTQICLSVTSPPSHVIETNENKLLVGVKMAQDEVPVDSFKIPLSVLAFSTVLPVRTLSTS